MAAPQIKSSYGAPKGGGYHASGSTKTYVKAYPPKGFGKGPSKNYGSDSIGQGSTQTFTTTTSFGKGPSKSYGSDSIGHGSTQTYTTTSYGSGKGSSPGKGSQSFSTTSYGSNSNKGKKQHQSFGDLVSKGTQTYGKELKSYGGQKSGKGFSYGKPGKGNSYSSYETGSSGYRGGHGKGKPSNKGHGHGSLGDREGGFLSSLYNSFGAGLSSHGFGHSSHASKGNNNKGHQQDQVHSASSYGPPKYSKGPRVSKATTYYPAPSSFNKPPIIIYQGVKPPVHVFEKPAEVGGYSSGGFGESTYSHRRISEAPVVTIDPRSKGDQTILSPTEFMSPQNTMWIPSYGMSQNGYHTALYVSDLTSAGTGQPQIFSAGAFGSPLGPLPQTQTVQVQNADGTSSTAQVLTQIQMLF